MINVQCEKIKDSWKVTKVGLTVLLDQLKAEITADIHGLFPVDKMTRPKPFIVLFMQFVAFFLISVLDLAFWGLLFSAIHYLFALNLEPWMQRLDSPFSFGFKQDSHKGLTSHATAQTVENYPHHIS